MDGVRFIPEEAFRKILDESNGHPAPLYELAGEPWNLLQVRPEILVGPGVVGLDLHTPWGTEREEVRTGAYRSIYIPLLVRGEALADRLRKALPDLVKAAEGAEERQIRGQRITTWTLEAVEAFERAAGILVFDLDEDVPVVRADKVVWRSEDMDPDTFADFWGEDLLDLLIRGEVDTVANEIYGYFVRQGYAVRGGLEDVREELRWLLGHLKGESEV